ncbi:MAG TPA: hypothetical protein VFV98_17160 [Vicinamibacterales bacterium]|nr:hypothetical protein [Vicinamibacterales bacterium]
MGKRELLIIAGFIVAGTVVYQLTAPDPKPGEKAFSFSGLVGALRREVRGNNANATDRREGTFKIPDSLSEVRIAGTIQKVTVVGENRPDVAYDLAVDSTGPDEATALSYAKRATLRNDDLGDILALRMGFPSEARQTATLFLRVPSRLTVRLEQTATRNANISDIKALHIEGGYGDLTVVNVAGSVTGSTRGGDLVLQDVGATMMTLRNTSAKVIRPRGTTKITATGGECTIDHAAGPIEFEQTNGAEVQIIAPQGPVRASGTGGQITVTDPRQEVAIDVRRAEIEVSLDQPVPVSALGTDEVVRLLLADNVAVALDAGATDGGKIDASEFDLTPETQEQGAKLLHAFPKGTTRVVLRTQRGEIVIRKRK